MFNFWIRVPHIIPVGVFSAVYDSNCDPDFYLYVHRETLLYITIFWDFKALFS